MIFEIDGYDSDKHGSFCNLTLKWAGPIEFTCYIRKENTQEVIMYLLNTQSDIYKELSAIHDRLLRLPKAKSKD